MIFEVLENTIRKRFQSLVVEPNGLIVVYPNQDLDVKQESQWCRISILPGISFQADLGSKKRFRTPGILIIQVFNKTGLGTKSIMKIIDLVNTTFRSITVGGVTYQTPNINHIGTRDGWYQVNITCPWYSDDVEI